MTPFKTLIALAAMLAAGSARADDGTCSNSSLQGQYAFKAQGANVGVLDATGALHPFASPWLVNGAGYFTFDGNGSLTKVDYMGNGTPSINPAIPLTDDGFRTGQTGTYAVDEDCTGNLVFDVPGGREIHVAFSVISFGQGVFGVVKSEHAPTLPAAILPAGIMCDSGC
ncbi:MAG: hypothetical protein JO227_25125, partial [Acetobacteraceae bacterium]|nr:hypothetical protein [Acetobacteraceae bacterium]